MYRGIGLNFDPLVMAAGAQAKAELEAMRRYEDMARKDAQIEMQAQQAAAQFGFIPGQYGDFAPQISVIPEEITEERMYVPPRGSAFSSIKQGRDYYIAQGLSPSEALEAARQDMMREPSSVLPPEIQGQDIVEQPQRAPSSPYRVPPQTPQGFVTPYMAQKRLEIEKAKAAAQAFYDRSQLTQQGATKRAEIQASSRPKPESPVAKAYREAALALTRMKPDEFIMQGAKGKREVEAKIKFYNSLAAMGDKALPENEFFARYRDNINAIVAADKRKSIYDAANEVFQELERMRQEKLNPKKGK